MDRGEGTDDQFQPPRSSEAVPGGGTTDGILRLARDRDAFGAIRGFVYQAELTILRWLRLADQEELELERGEDIDRVARDLGAGPSVNWDRLMEQVKLRERPLTLRSESVRSALANFFEHRLLNRNLSLRFRFTTNARPGREQKNMIPGGLTGIDAWQKLHAGEVGGDGAAAAIGAMRELLLRKKKPEGITSVSWGTWQAFVRSASEDDILGFIRQVEIATGEANPESLGPHIQQLLLEEAYVEDEAAANRLYPVLFVAVLKLLSERGRKVLTRADLLAEIEGVGPGATDTQLVAKLHLLLLTIADRLDAVESDITAIRTDVGEMREGMSAVAEELAAERFPPGAHPGDSRTFQTTENYFGYELNTASTFNHARALQGRAEELTLGLDAVRSAAPDESRVVVVTGRGGVGKSRLLIELAKRVAESGDTAVLWLRDQESPSPESLNELPAGPLAIFCDDAHRRPDLDRLLSFVSAREDKTVLFVGIRPHGQDALGAAGFRSGFGKERIVNIGDLDDLRAEELVPLVAAELEIADRHWAESIVKVARGSTLVALVAARLLRTRRLNPAILAQDEEVHHVVFSNFEDEIYGQVSREVDPSQARRVLELFAAISPVRLAKDDEVQRIANFLGLNSPDLLRIVGKLQEAGVLREHRTGIRIIPDVLSDHILQRKLVAAGRSTHAEIQILEGLGDGVLPDLLRNVGDLDWQLNADSEKPGIDVFSDLWARFEEAFHKTSNYQRRSLLERLLPVAGFQPERVLALCEWLTDNPENPPEAPPQEAWKPSTVLEQIPPVLAGVAQHEAYFQKALDLLWRLGRVDRRDLNPHPEHAIRTLEEVVKYAPWRYVWRQELAADVLCRWTRQVGWSRAAHSPLVVARAILSTSMVEDRFDSRQRTITMTRHRVNPNVTRAARVAVIDLLAELALGSEPRGRVWATELLLKALDPPDSQFGHVVTDDEEELFRFQYEAAFDAVERIAGESKDPIVRIKLRDGLRWAVRRTGLLWKRTRARGLIGRFQETNETEFSRVWGRTFRDALTSWELTAKHGDELTDRVASRLAVVDGGADSLLARLVIEHERFADAGVDQFPGALLARFAEKRGDLAVQIASSVVRSEPDSAESRFWPWLHFLLLPARRLQSAVYEDILAAAVNSSQEGLRRAATRILGWNLPEAKWSEIEQEYVSALLRDPDASVRAEAIDALNALPPGARGGYLRHVEVGGSADVADVLAANWAYRPKTEWPDVDSADIRRILEMLVDLPNLGHRHGQIEEMLAAFAKSEPLLVLDFIIARVRREAEFWAIRTPDFRRSYDAVPYGGFHSIWAELQGSSKHPEIVRQLLTAISEEDRSGPEWINEALKVAQSVIRWDAEVERTLHEWMADGRCDDIVALHRWFAGQPPLFVIEHRAFVAKLIGWLDEHTCGGREGVENAFLRLVSGGIRMRSGRGPNELDSQLREGARSAIQEMGLDSNGAATRFFNAVESEAAQRLANERERDVRAEAFEATFDFDDD